MHEKLMLTFSLARTEAPLSYSRQKGGFWQGAILFQTPGNFFKNLHSF